MLLTILEVVGHMWPLLPIISISSCSTYVTGLWLQQQPEGSMVFIHRLSEIGWDKMFNLFVCTDCNSIEFSPDIIELQGGMVLHLQHFHCANWNLLLFSGECRFNLRHANGHERVCRCRRKSIFPMHASLSWTVYMLTAYSAVSQCVLHKMVDTWDIDSWIFSLFLLVDIPPNKFKPVLLCNCVVQN